MLRLLRKRGFSEVECLVCSEKGAFLKWNASFSQKMSFPGVGCPVFSEKGSYSCEASFSQKKGATAVKPHFLRKKEEALRAILVGVEIEGAFARCCKRLPTLWHLCAVRKIIAYKEYFSEFIQGLSKLEAERILRALDLLRTEDQLPRHYIKYVREGLYEFRVSHGNNEFRLFFIYDGETIVVLFNCFKKKTWENP